MKKITKKIIVANWKMYGSPEMAKNWVQEVRGFLSVNSCVAVDIIVCPPAPLLYLLKNELAGLLIQLGGQDCHMQAEGAYTGEISADLLKSVGAEYVLVGHSERRINNLESNEIICRKAARAMQSGLIPIICIGETAEQRASGKTIEVLHKQIVESIPQEAKKSNFILAYEPIWAIGSGKVPTSAEIKSAHEAIISTTMKHTGLACGDVCVLYGGSVKSENAGEILAIAGVAGVLVGGASLVAGEFYKIAEC
jgi:triosephosphate isomerase